MIWKEELFTIIFLAHVTGNEVNWNLKSAAVAELGRQESISESVTMIRILFLGTEKEIEWNLRNTG
jgi:hypothetical protein